MKKNESYYVFSWRVPLEYKDKIQELAKSKGLNMSAYLRELVMAEVDRVDAQKIIDCINNRFTEMEEKQDARLKEVEKKLDILKQN